MRSCFTFSRFSPDCLLWWPPFSALPVWHFFKDVCGGEERRLEEGKGGGYLRRLACSGELVFYVYIVRSFDFHHFIVASDAALLSLF